MNIPESAEYDTFSGYVLEQLGRIPDQNEEIRIGDYDIVVKAKEGNRIKEYLVRHSVKKPLDQASPNSQQA
jgi:putative hemolysin